MHTTLLTTLSLALSTTAVVLPRELSQQTITNAGGAPPNGSLPPHISDSAVADFQGVNFLENLESAFFAAGLANLTGKWYDHHLDQAISIVTKVQAQELIHVQTAENILTNYHNKTFTPCSYTFPVNTPNEFFSLSNTITSIGLGAVISLASSLALTDPSLVPGPASILAIEARHDAFFRAAAHISPIPNPAPFDTPLSSTYALNLALPFIVPGSCTSGMPSFPLIPALKTETPSSTSSPLTGSTGPISFSFNTSQVPTSSNSSSSPYFIAWINQANSISYTPATIDAANGHVTSYIPNGLAGVAFAVLTAQNGATDVETLTGETVAGPAVVQIS